jgi:hypothetical protein
MIDAAQFATDQLIKLDTKLGMREELLCTGYHQFDATWVRPLRLCLCRYQ